MQIKQSQPINGKLMWSAKHPPKTALKVLTNEKERALPECLA